MERIMIRDIRSRKEIKPRVFDVLIEEGKIMLDIKDSRKGNIIIALDDVLVQLVEPGQGKN